MMDLEPPAQQYKRTGQLKTYDNRTGGWGTRV